MKKAKFLLPGAVTALSALCLAVIVWLAVAGRRDAAEFAEAAGAFEQGDYRSALPRLAAVVGKDPSNAAAYRMLGAIFESERNYSSALFCYRQAKGLDPQDPALKTKYAEMLSAVGDARTLLNSFKQDFDRKKLSGDDLFYYLEALIADGKSEAAEAVLKTGQPDEAARIAYLRGFLALKRNDPAAALHSFAKIPDGALPVPARLRLLGMTGAVQFAAGNEAEAEKAFRLLAAEVPETGDYLLAQFYRRTGREREYRVQLEETVQANPLLTAARIELAEQYAGEKNTAGLKQLLRQPNNRAEAEAFSYIEAMRALLEGRFADAEKSLSAAAAFAGRPLYQAIRMQCRIARQDVGMLPESVNALLRLTPTPEARSQVVSELFPLLLELARRDAGTEAAECAELILSVSDQPSPARTTALEVRLQTAAAAGDPAGMLRSAAALLKENPDHPAANLAMGDAQLAMRKPDAALDCFNRLPADSPTAQFGKARAFAMQQKPDEADRMYAAAWRQAPGNLVLFESYAAFLIDRKRGGEIAALAVELPATPGARHLAAFQQARAAEAGNSPDEARKHYLDALAALEKLPPSPAVDYRRAYLSALAGRDTEAEALYGRLLEDNPQSLPVLLNLSEVKAALGKKQEALSLARSAARLAPDSEAARQCLKRRGQENRP